VSVDGGNGADRLFEHFQFPSSGYPAWPK
jgi:hypothetical protein